MKEILTCRIWTGDTMRVAIDRETGKFALYNSRFRLDILDNKAFLFDYNSKTPLFEGCLHGNYWFFEDQDYIREDEDPYVASIQVLYDILQCCKYG
jgi:hypothetical protein